MNMNADPSRRHSAKKLLATLPAAAAIAACTSGSPDSSGESSAVGTTSPTASTSEVEWQTVFCNSRPEDKWPAAGAGTSAYRFTLGNPAAPGRIIGWLAAELKPPGPDAPPGANAGLAYEWGFAEDVPPPNPAETSTTTKLAVDGTTYVMGITAKASDEGIPWLESFCAPEGSPSIPTPNITFPPTTT